MYVTYFLVLFFSGLYFFFCDLGRLLQAKNGKRIMGLIMITIKRRVWCWRAVMSSNRMRRKTRIRASDVRVEVEKWMNEIMENQKIQGTVYNVRNGEWHCARRECVSEGEIRKNHNCQLFRCMKINWAVTPEMQCWINNASGGWIGAACLAINRQRLFGLMQ